MLFPVLLFLLLAIILYVPPVQNFVVERVATRLSASLGMDVGIERVRLAFPLDLALHRLHAVERGDTLAAVRSLRLDVRLLPLLHGEADVDGFELYGATLDTKSYISDTHIRGHIGRLAAASHGIGWTSGKIRVDFAELADADVSIALSDTAQADTTTSTTAWDIGVRRVSIANTRVRLSMPGDSMRIGARLGRAELRDGRFETGRPFYGVRSLTIADGALSYDLPHVPAAPGLDPAHIAVSRLALRVEQASYGPGGEVNAHIRRLVLHEKSGLAVSSLSGCLRLDTTRIALLLSRAMARPSQILAVTFTNKAAREMRDRLSAMVSCDLRHLWMGTFHGTAHRILRAHAQEANLPPTFQIIDTSDQLSLIRRIMKEAGIDPKLRDPKTVQWAINSYKEQGLRAGAVAAREEDKTRVTLYETYEARCQREGLVDFAELMLRCVELLEGNQLVREHYNDRFKYVLVDEFQDTDSLQFRLIKALCPPKQSNACVFCVGDDDQSIYAFRGAKVGNMSDFVKDYKVEKIIKLEQNYRSTSHILDGANAVIANNKDRMGKNLWTDAGAGEPIRLYRAEADMQEARAVVQDIMVEKRRGKKYSDFAILYRNNNLSRNFERMLSANSIPYRVYGGLRFFDRQEVKDVVAYLRVLANADDTSLLRIINQPPRGIGATTVERATTMASDAGVTIWEILAEADSVPEIRRAHAFVTLLEEISAEAEGKSRCEADPCCIAVSILDSISCS